MARSMGRGGVIVAGCGCAELLGVFPVRDRAKLSDMHLGIDTRRTS